MILLTCASAREVPGLYAHYVRSGPYLWATRAILRRTANGLWPALRSALFRY